MHTRCELSEHFHLHVYEEHDEVSAEITEVMDALQRFWNLIPDAIFLSAEIGPSEQQLADLPPVQFIDEQRHISLGGWKRNDAAIVSLGPGKIGWNQSHFTRCFFQRRSRINVHDCDALLRSLLQLFHDADRFLGFIPRFGRMTENEKWIRNNTKFVAPIHYV